MKDRLKTFFTQHWTYLAVSTACKLNLFDCLHEQKTATQVATELSLTEEKVVLLLNALHSAEFLDKKEDHFKVNAMSELLTENHPESLKYACLNWSAEHLTAWQNLDFSIKTGKSAFEESYGLPFFDYLNEHPEKLNAYHKAMYQYAKEDYQNLPDILDFSKYKSVMDVGGGYGAIVELIKAKDPAIECVLFDLDKVISTVSIPNIKKVSGSFFDKIPNQSEVIILSRVLHDWNNANAAVILQNCLEALPKDGALFVIENCSDKISIDLSLLSLNMTAMCESHERTSSAYISLCENAGFQLESELKLNELQTILIFKK
ncbi:methyltransferase [Flavobacterium lacus]|uniref:Methyltransferase family protein n=1 Tax=Flavobacterium lacus TaxID=1353778 RepID=A0A328WMW2_9FLAO|nr:methyltransferase [Flavobacterium lacus]RAR46476.1 methyltransferase family protein [Flavobacterium lacus]